MFESTTRGRCWYCRQCAPPDTQPPLVLLNAAGTCELCQVMHDTLEAMRQLSPHCCSFDHCMNMLREVLSYSQVRLQGPDSDRHQFEPLDNEAAEADNEAAEAERRPR